MTFAMYRDYKVSGVPWLGAIPAHWEVRRLKTLFNLMKRPPMDDDGIVTAFRDGEVTLRSNRRVEGFTNAVQEIGYQGIRTGDLVIHAMDAFAGAIGVSDSNGKSTPVYSVCMPVGSGVDSGYYGQTLRHMALSGYVNSLAKGIRERSTEFRWSDASIVELPFPPIEEQLAVTRFIAGETTKIDALVAEQEQLITLLKEKRQAVISHVVTKGLDPSVPMKDSGVKWLGETPVHWEVKQIRQSAQILRGKFTHRPRNDPAFYDGDHPFIQTGDVTAAKRLITEFKQTLNDKGAGVSKEFPRGTLVMTIAANIGDVAVLDFPAYFPDSVVGLVPGSSVDLMFLFYLMKSMKQPLEMNATISTQMNLNAEQIGSLAACCPPITEQRAIVQHLDVVTEKLDDLIDEAEAAVLLLQERRSALISAAVTGQIDVRQIK